MDIKPLAKSKLEEKKNEAAPDPKKTQKPAPPLPSMKKEEKTVKEVAKQKEKKAYPQADTKVPAHPNMLLREPIDGVIEKTSNINGGRPPNIPLLSAGMNGTPGI